MKNVNCMAQMDVYYVKKDYQFKMEYVLNLNR